jgi:hypothetical protein
MDERQYKNATDHYIKAFEAFDWKGLANDRLKAARAFVLAGERDSALIYLDHLCRQQYINHLVLTSDPSLSLIRNSAPEKWEKILACIKHNKDLLAPKQNLAWTKYLDTVYQTDQGIRLKFMKVADQHGWNSKEAKAYLTEMRLIDSVNQKKITTFIDTNGWPGQEEIGSQGSSTLFLVIQHSDSAIQEKYIPLLREAVRQKKARPQDLALMEDRLSISKYGYQMYGSQIEQDTVTKKFIILPIKDEADVNKRRAQVGLQPLEEYVKSWGIEYKGKGN